MSDKYPCMSPAEREALTALLGRQVCERMYELEMLDIAWQRDAEGAERDQPIMRAEHGIVRAWSISRQQGIFLYNLVRLLRPKRLLELAGSLGYSTLWLSTAAREVNASVVTVERDLTKLEILRETASLFPGVIDISDRDIGDFLKAGPQPFDLVFLDADPFLYGTWGKALDAVLAPGGTVVVDNALSPAYTVPLVRAFVASLEVRTSWTVPVGHGMLIALGFVRVC